MDVINASVSNRDILNGTTEVYLYDNETTAIKFSYPDDIAGIPTVQCTKTAHIMLPDGTEFARELENDTLVITRDMTSQVGRVLYNIKFTLPGETIPVWSTNNTFFKILNRIDADFSEIERTDPSIIEQFTAKIAEHDTRITVLETTGGGGSGSYVETDPTVPAWAKEATKPVYTAEEVGALPSDTVIPSKISELTNDGGFLNSFDISTLIDAHNANAGAHPTILAELESQNGRISVLESLPLPSDGTTDHTQLINRDAADQHPMSAITGLILALAGKQAAGNYITNETDPTVPAWAKEATKPAYTAEEVGALPSSTVIPSKISELVNDSSFIAVETDPTVPAWAKAATKPSYTAEEVGALPSDTIIPSKISELTNDSSFITVETDPTVPAWAKQATKPVYTAEEVGALPSSTVIPSKISELTNDSSFVTVETDPTVPAWAKTATKPTYNASEVGAEASGAVSAHDTSETSHNDLRALIALKANLADILWSGTQEEFNAMTIEQKRAHLINVTIG